MRISDWSSDVCSSDLHSDATSASQHRRQGRPADRRRPLHLRKIMKFHGFQRLLRLRRRRSTEDGIRIASRYFPTVRRAMSMPSDLTISTIPSSDNTTAGAASWLSARMRKRPDEEEWDSPPPTPSIANEKKDFS